ncbi:hypothetical protein GCM10027084_22490 [Pseudoxanthomonas sangjuensis]|uniref:hypothetical protein n=1 Tax=Pseudoxanthomonas sangjuensis TaxID=1503750 RepID=UPI0013912EF4|nr:hypothetical protein [Pseudoxanthomonas sangjuensis]KAF1715039.1 hypothetical protein CSC71_02160 [Pseudoxanthomonas sangjuensis]
MRQLSFRQYRKLLQADVREVDAGMANFDWCKYVREIPAKDFRGHVHSGSLAFVLQNDQIGCQHFLIATNSEKAFMAVVADAAACSAIGHFPIEFNPGIELVCESDREQAPEECNRFTLIEALSWVAEGANDVVLDPSGVQKAALKFALAVLSWPLSMVLLGLTHFDLIALWSIFGAPAFSILYWIDLGAQIRLHGRRAGWIKALRVFGWLFGYSIWALMALAICAPMWDEYSAGKRDLLPVFGLTFVMVSLPVFAFVWIFLNWFFVPAFLNRALQWAWGKLFGQRV